MYCPKCGTYLAEEKPFCIYCGTQLKEISNPLLRSDRLSVPVIIAFVLLSLLLAGASIYLGYLVTQDGAGIIYKEQELISYHMDQQQADDHRADPQRQHG
jgi:hypothetical protein